MSVSTGRENVPVIFLSRPIYKVGFGVSTTVTTTLFTSFLCEFDTGTQKGHHTELVYIGRPGRLGPRGIFQST